MAASFDPYPSRPLSDFRDELQFEYPELPTELFDYYILRTARDMARRGGLLPRVVRIRLKPGVTRYLLESPDGLEIDAVTSARVVHDGNEEHGSRPIRRYPTPPVKSACWVTDGAWYLPDEGVIVIHLPVCGPNALARIGVRTMPARDACELPEVFLEKYLPVLMLGARASIVKLTGRPWTDLQLGDRLQAEYVDALGMEGARVKLGGQSGLVRMRCGRVL